MSKPFWIVLHEEEHQKGKGEAHNSWGVHGIPAEHSALSVLLPGLSIFLLPFPVVPLLNALYHGCLLMDHLEHHAREKKFKLVFSMLFHSICRSKYRVWTWKLHCLQEKAK